MMNIGVMLRLCTLGVWDVCLLGLHMKFAISLNVWLIRLGSMTMLERSLVALFPVVHATALDKDQFGDISYEQPHTACVPISCDFCYCSDHNANSCPHITSIDFKIGQIM